jgi:hypothetical protein
MSSRYHREEKPQFSFADDYDFKDDDHTNVLGHTMKRNYVPEYDFLSGETTQQTDKKADNKSSDATNRSVVPNKQAVDVDKPKTTQ